MKNQERQPREPRPPSHPIFSVAADAFLSLGGHATVRSGTTSSAVDARERVVDLGIFVGASTFVGHGTVVDATARLSLKRGLSGFVTLFVSVAGEVLAVAEALVTDDMELLVADRDGFIGLHAFLGSFGTVATEVVTVDEPDADAAHAWMSGLALGPIVERGTMRRLSGPDRRVSGLGTAARAIEAVLVEGTRGRVT
jgi:hypothetical protein